MELAPAPSVELASRRRRAIAEEQVLYPPRQRIGFGGWYSSLSGFAKLRLVLIVLLLIWLLGVALPLAMIEIARGANFADGRPFPVVASGSLAAVYSMGSYEVARADQVPGKPFLMTFTLSSELILPLRH